MLASEVFYEALTLNILVSYLPYALGPFPGHHHPVAMHKEIIAAEIMIGSKSFKLWGLVT